MRIVAVARGYSNTASPLSHNLHVVRLRLPQVGRDAVGLAQQAHHQVDQVAAEDCTWLRRETVASYVR